MNKKLIILCLLFSIANIECKKDNTNTGSPAALISVATISQTNASGQAITPPDTTQWTYDKSWMASEYALLQTPVDTQLTNEVTATISMYAAYPNPAGNVISVPFNTSGLTLLQVVIVDDLLNIKDRFFIHTRSGQNDVQFNLDATKYSNHTNYRMYYGFYSAASALYYKGHGNIEISR